MSPKKVNKEEKKMRIIEAAIRVFAKVGLPNARMMQIAEAAGIGKGTIYEYFRSKDDLFIAAFNAHVTVFERQLNKRIRHIEDPVERLHTYIASWSEIFDTDMLEFADIMLDIWAAGLRKQDGRTLIDLNRLYTAYRKQIVKILEAGIAQKKFKPTDTAVTASIIIGTIDGLLIQWLLDKELYDFPESVRQLADMVVEGILIRD